MAGSESPFLEVLETEDAFQQPLQFLRLRSVMAGSESSADNLGLLSLSGLAGGGAGVGGFGPFGVPAHPSHELSSRRRYFVLPAVLLVLGAGLVVWAFRSWLEALLRDHTDALGGGLGILLVWVGRNRGRS